MQIRKMLFVTQFEELWFDALRSLLDLRQVALEHVVFVNVIERDKVAMHRGKGYQKELEIQLREKANVHFIDWAETLFEEGMEVGVYIVVGTLVDRVVRAARKEEADLIVLGDRRRGPLQQFYAGSELSEIVRRTQIPVMLYRYSGERHQAIPPFARPLLATDWGPASRRAVEYLRHLKPLIEEVHVVHAVSENKLRGDSAMTIQQTRKDHRARLEEICELFEADDIPAKAHLVIGDPMDMMAKASRQCQASMIISGISARQGWTSRWRSGRSESIGDRSGLTTLLVPAMAPDTMDGGA